MNDVMRSPDLDLDLGLEATPRSSAPHPVAVLRAVGRRLLPSLIEATLVPTLLFYAVFALVGATGAFIAALGWSYLAIGRRLASRTPIPGIMILAGIGITLRTTFAIASGSSFVYFVQPVLGTLVLSAVMVISVIVGRPLIGRFASDFCALEPGIASRPGVVQAVQPPHLSLGGGQPLRGVGHPRHVAHHAGRRVRRRPARGLLAAHPHRHRDHRVGVGAGGAPGGPAPRDHQRRHPQRSRQVAPRPSDPVITATPLRVAVLTW